MSGSGYALPVSIPQNIGGYASVLKADDANLHRHALLLHHIGNARPDADIQDRQAKRNSLQRPK